MLTQTNSLKPSTLAPPDCTCTVLCHCDAGLPQGAELVTLLLNGIAIMEAKLPFAGLREAAMLKKSISRAKLTVRREELAVEFTTEYQRLA